MGRVSRKIEQLKFAIYCFKRSNDSRFQRRVREIGQDVSLVSVERLVGTKDTDLLYFIDMEESHSGFFAEHNRLLSMLYFADYYHLRPVVRYHSGYCYAEDHPVNGTMNPFEYYFEQPAGISLDDLNEYSCVIKCRKENSYITRPLNTKQDSYDKSERYLHEMGRITGKYIRLNEIVRNRIDADIAALGLTACERTLAVHVRGTDFKQHFNGHPVIVTVEEYLKEAVRLCRDKAYDKVFLATDDSDAVASFEQEFGERLLYYRDVTRSNGNDTVMNSTSTRKNHHYLLGLEVLRDVHTMARCQGLLAGRSQVSYGARIQKYSTGEEYDDLVIIDKGTNYHQRNNAPA